MNYFREKKLSSSKNEGIVFIRDAAFHFDMKPLSSTEAKQAVTTAKQTISGVIF